MLTAAAAGMGSCWGCCREVNVWDVSRPGTGSLRAEHTTCEDTFDSGRMILNLVLSTCPCPGAETWILCRMAAGIRLHQLQVLGVPHIRLQHRMCCWNSQSAGRGAVHQQSSTVLLLHTRHCCSDSWFSCTCASLPSHQPQCTACAGALTRR
jgi:hypothetical protein